MRPSLVTPSKNSHPTVYVIPPFLLALITLSNYIFYLSTSRSPTMECQPKRNF